MPKRLGINCGYGVRDSFSIILKTRVYGHCSQGSPIRDAVQAAVGVSTVPVPVQPKTKKVRGQGKHSMCEYNLHVNALNITVSYSIGLGPSNEKRFEPDHKRRKKGWSQNQYTL